MKKLFVLLVAVLVMNSTLRAEDDVQFWLDGNLSGKLNDTYSIVVNQETWWTDDASDLTYFHVQTAIKRPVTDWLGAAVAYRQKYAKSKNEWKEENRWLLDLTLKTKLKGWGFSNRNRFELRMRDGRDNVHRFRNKTGITLPVKFTDWGITPYIQEEFFIDDDTEEINQNRVYVGLGAKPADNLKAKLYYMLLSNKKECDWQEDHVIGLAATLLL